MLLELGIYFLLSFLLTSVFVPLCARIAFRWHILDIPDGVVKNHKRPTPYLGGVALYLGFLFGFLASLSQFSIPAFIFWFVLGATFLLIVGLIDDILVLKPWQKLAGQFFAVFFFIKAGIYHNSSFLCSPWHSALFVVWILAVVNGFNLIDVMDGLATSVAMAAASSFLAVAIFFNIIFIAVAASVLLGALVAFFLYNKPPATIYLGDAGALFLGGFFAGLPLLISWGEFVSYGYLVPPTFLAIPLLEVATLVVVRKYKKIPFYLASPDHFSLYLQKGGWSKWQVLLYILCIAISLFAIGFLFVAKYISIAMFFVLGGVVCVSWYGILLNSHFYFLKKH